jgi:activating signal cointegrator 1
MKAISLWQLWASLMAVDAKRIETRHWSTQYRGELAIHAAQRKVKRELEEYLGDPVFRHALFPDTADDTIWFPDQLIEEIPFGAVVCVVEIYDCWPVERIISLQRYGSAAELAFGNYDPGRFGFLTRNCRRLAQPVPTRGFQGFWDLPAAIEAQVRNSIAQSSKAAEPSRNRGDHSPPCPECSATGQHYRICSQFEE